MNGSELRELRKSMGFTQDDLMQELGVKSRQTLVSWEKSETDLPRLVTLAMSALEKLPDCRRMHGKKATAEERKAFDQDG